MELKLLGTILIIDDNEDILELLSIILGRKGYVVLSSSSGAAALDLLRPEKLPDVILLDVEMPDMRGTEFLDRLELRCPKAIETSAIVFYTAGEFPTDERVRAYLNKMSDLNETVGLVGDLVSRRASDETLYSTST